MAQAFRQSNAWLARTRLCLRDVITRVGRSAPGLSAWLARNGIFVCIAIVWLPLALQKIASPIQLFDYLASFPDEAAHVGDWLSWNSLVPNFFENLLFDPWHFRPFGFALMHLLSLIFGSNYYLQFIVKFVLHAVLVVLIFQVVRLQTQSVVSAYMAAIVMIVHPAPISLMLYSTEGPFTLAVVGTLWFMLRYLRVWTHDANGRLILAGGSVSLACCAIAFLLVALVCGLKDNGVLFGAVLFVVLSIWLVSSSRSRLTKSIFFFASLGFVILCVLRVRSVRDHVMSVTQLKLSSSELFSVLTTRLFEALQFVMPIQPNAGAGVYVGVLMIFVCLVLVYRLIRALPACETWAEFLGVVFSFNAVVLALFIVAIVSVSIPSGYPPRVSPRYVVPAAALLAIALGIVGAPLIRRLPALGVAISVYLLLAAPNITFARENEWSAVNNTFVAFTQRIGDLLERGNKVYVGQEVEFGRTLLRLFGPDGRRLFGNRLGDIRKYSAAETQDDRFILVSFEQPNELLRSGRYKIEKIEAALPVIPESTGFARLTRVWQRLGRALGGQAVPYLESGTISLTRRPLMYLYHVCPIAAQPKCGDVLAEAVSYGEFCEGSKQVPLSSEAPNDGWTQFAGGEKGFRVAFPTPANDPVDRIVVAMGSMRVAPAMLRILLARQGALVWDTWLYPSRQEFEVDAPVLLANSGPYRIDLFAYPGEVATFGIRCPLRVMGVQVHVLRAPVRLGSFSG